MVEHHVDLSCQESSSVQDVDEDEEGSHLTWCFLYIGQAGTVTRATTNVLAANVSMQSCMFCVKYPSKNATVAPRTRPSCMIRSAKR